MRVIPTFLSTKLLLLLATGALQARPLGQDRPLLSPDKHLAARVSVAQGEAFYTVYQGATALLLPSKLGVVREDANFAKGLHLVATDKAQRVTDRYALPGGKRTNCVYEANEQVYHLQNAAGEAFNVIFRVSNDGVAFRYEFPGKSADVKQITEESTSFHFGTDTRTWLQPKAEAQSGWKNTNPSYEEAYLPDQPAGQPSPTHNGWVYPALFRTHGTWLLLTEANLGTTYCGTALRAEAPGNEYRIGFPQAAEAFPGGALNPASVLPWRTPWRIITIGSLATIVESTLGTDLAAPAVPLATTSFIRPGKAAWSWALGTDNATNYDTQRQYIDYAARMGWAYSLIDADWDTRIGYDRVQELATYAKSKNVGLLLWYNSSGPWNLTDYHPKSQLLTHADRVKEFARLREMGIQGVKIDFFGGDGQSFMAYYQDILRDAAAYQLLVNFHGATLPRGWQRTYPNLMSTEAVRGFEMIYSHQIDADRQAAFCTMLPFTRNAFDPMDFTPVSLNAFENKRVRKTTNGFELAQAVLYLSTIQHYAESPAGMAKQPAEVQAVLRQIPAVWDEVRFLDGFPGKYVVVARRAGTQWYVAGINGETQPKTLRLDLSFLPAGQAMHLFGDGADQYSFSQQTLAAGKQVMVTMQPSGGFLLCNALETSGK